MARNHFYRIAIHSQAIPGMHSFEWGRVMEASESQVCIVGVGLTGAVVARGLSTKVVRCFDKSRGAGGRMSTRRTESGVINHGAPSFIASDTAFRAQVDAWAKAELLQADLTTPNLFRPIGAMNRLIKALHQGLDVTFQMRLIALEKTTTGWRLRFENGHVHDAKNVVLTMPSPQMIELLTASRLPTADVENIRYVPQWAVLIEGARQQLDPERLPRGTQQVSHAGGLCVHFAPSWSEENLELTPMEVIERLREIAPPTFQAFSAHRWRFARVNTSIASTYIEHPAGHLWLCGDGFGGEGIEVSYLSAISCVNALRSSTKSLQ